MRMAAEGAPAKLLANVIDPGRRIDLGFVAGFAPRNATDGLARWNGKSVITARPDSRRVVAAGHRRAEQRAAVMVRPINIDGRLTARCGYFGETCARHRASRQDTGERDCEPCAAAHGASDRTGAAPTSCARRS